MPDANLIIGVTYDDKGRAALIASNERAFKQSSSRMAAHEQQARRGSAFSGGQNAAYRTGMISQQAQDVAVSLQMGMSASRVIAQQGSQIASIFGPKGMVIGVVIAIGAAIWEMASATAQAEKKAEALQKQWEKINAIRKEAVALEAEARQSRVTRELGGFAGEIEGQDADYQRKVIDNIERQVAVNRKKAQDINKEATGGGWRDLAQTVPILRAFVDDSATANARKRKEIADGAAEEIAALNRVMAGEKAVAVEKLATFEIKQRIASQESVFASKSRAVMADARAREVTEKDKEKTEDLEREMNFIESRNKIRDSSASAQQKNAQYAAIADERAAKDDEVAATRQRKREEENVDRYLKDAEKQVKLTEEKTKNEKEASQFRDTSVQKYKRAQDEVKKIESEIAKGGAYNTPEKQAELAEKKLELLKQEQGAVKEIEAMQSEGVDFTKAGLAGTEAQQRMEAVQMEINLLEKKKAFSPIEAAQTANRIALLNRELVAKNFDTGAMGGAGMQQINRNRNSQLKAMDRAEQRALGNMGLMDIKRGLGGEMISGVDPITGRILGPKEIEERKFEMGLEKDRRDLDRAQTKGDIDKASALIQKQDKQKSDLEAKAAKGDRAAQDKLDRMNKFQQNGGKENIAAGFSPEQVTALSKSIADAVKELIAK